VWADWDRDLMKYFSFPLLRRCCRDHLSWAVVTRSVCPFRFDIPGYQKGRFWGADFFHDEDGGTGFEEIIPADLGVDFSEKIICFGKRAM